MYQQLKGQGFTIVAVNGFEKADVIQRYIARGKFTFPIVMNGKGNADMVKRYGVQAFPTNYVLDRNGKIVARSIGFNEEAIKAALRKLGLRVKDIKEEEAKAK